MTEPLLTALAELTDEERADTARTLREVLDELPPAPGDFDARIRRRFSDVADSFERLNQAQ